MNPRNPLFTIRDQRRCRIAHPRATGATRHSSLVTRHRAQRLPPAQSTASIVRKERPPFQFSGQTKKAPQALRSPARESALPSLATRLSSLVSRHSSLVTRLSSLVSRLSSLVTRHASRVTRHRAPTARYSTVTDFAKFLGLSTSHPRSVAI